MSGSGKKVLSRRRQAKEFTIHCRTLMLIVKRYPGAWIASIEAADQRYLAIEKDENQAKKACLEVATAILRGCGDPLPDCLIRPRWVSK